MNEFELIAKYFSWTGEKTGAKPGVTVGVGDDCCLLSVAADKQLAVSVDTLVAGVHFPNEANAGDIASRALRVCLSDLAAMGAEARWFTLALTLPEINQSWLASFSASLKTTAEKFSCVLTGGDITRGPLTISIQVMGEVAKEKALLRSGAKPGDSIYVSGSLGDAAAALAILQNKFEPVQEVRAFLLRRYYHPEPAFAIARKIQGLASAAIDISDGLLADLGHICEQSRVGAEIDLQQLPWSSELASVGTEVQRETWALSGGDDYELCFTVPAEKVSVIDEMTLSGTLNATAIGQIVEGSKIQCYKQGKLSSIESSGYMHFE